VNIVRSIVNTGARQALVLPGLKLLPDMSKESRYAQHGAPVQNCSENNDAIDIAKRAS
jgi:hypothetical protein